MSELKYYRALIFDENAIEALRTYATTSKALLRFLLAMLVFSLPVTLSEIPLTPKYFIYHSVIFLIAVLLCYVFSRWLGTMTPFSRFWYTISTVLLFASIPMALIAYICIGLFEMVFDVAAVSNLITSLIPFYWFILFGFAVEGGAKIENEKKSAILGILAIFVIFFAMYYLPAL